MATKFLGGGVPLPPSIPLAGMRSCRGRGHRRYPVPSDGHLQNLHAGVQEAGMLFFRYFDGLCFGCFFTAVFPTPAESF